MIFIDRCWVISVAPDIVHINHAGYPLVILECTQDLGLNLSSKISDHEAKLYVAFSYMYVAMHLKDLRIN